MFLFKRNRNATRKLFISLGAGINQMPLIKEAKNLGYFLVGVDRNFSAAGASLCDIIIQDSIENYGEIFKKLEEIIIYGDIKGVLSRSYGNAIKSACFLAGQFHIPMMPYNRVDDFIIKKNMKDIFARNNIKSPGYIILEEPGMARKISKLGFPIVIKPVSGHAKRDVQLINKNSELRRYLKQQNLKKESFIAEQYIKGEEIIAAGIVHQGHFYLIEITDKTTTPPPYFVDLVHSSPSKHTGLWDKISAIGQEVASSFEITMSPLIMELLISDNNDIHLIEAVPEFGGEYIADILVPASTGYNFLREAVKAVTNSGFSAPIPKKNKQSVVIKYLTGKKGKIISFDEKSAKKSSHLLFLKIFKKIGDDINSPATNHDRIGVIITKGKTTGDALMASDNALKRLNLIVDDLD